MTRSESDDRLLTLHPDPEKHGTRILKSKYDAVRAAILKAVPTEAPGLAFGELPAAVRGNLSPADRESLGSVGWYTTVVKLDLEARGELRRIPGARPQRLIRC